MAAFSSHAAQAKLFLCASLRGCAQLAFCDSTAAGLLILGGITLTSAFAGLGAFAGALFGTVAGRFIPAYGREEWGWGLAGFNPAIIGLLCGGFLASAAVDLGFIVAVLTLSMAVDVACRRLLGRFMLPALSCGALLTTYLASLALAPHGAWLWTDAPTGSFIPYGALGGACIAVAMIRKCPFAGAWALLLSVGAYLACWLAEVDPRAAAGLWGITVPLACFGVHAIFLRGSLAGCIAGSVAATFGALIWIAWQASPLAQWLPPLLLPFILGVWSSMLLMRKLTDMPLAQPSLWRIARLLGAARAANREVVAVLPCGTGPQALSSFINGAWLDPQTPRAAFERDHLQMSPRCRRAFWDASDRLRAEARQQNASDSLARLNQLQRDGWIDAVVIQDALLPGPGDTSGALVALHGNVERTQCLDCGAQSVWPPMPVWRRCDLRCPTCQGPVVPALTLFGSAIDTSAASRLGELATRSAVVLVVGDEAREPATLDFLERARRAGATVVFISNGTVSYPRRPADISVTEPEHSFLASLVLVLAVFKVLAAFGTRWTRRAASTMARAKQGGEGAR